MAWTEGKRVYFVWLLVGETLPGEAVLQGRGSVFLAAAVSEPEQPAQCQLRLALSKRGCSTPSAAYCPWLTAAGTGGALAY